MAQLASIRGHARLAALLGLLLLLLPAVAAPVWALPLLTLTVTTGDSPAHVGDTVEFVFTATNNGSIRLSGLAVSGDLCDSDPTYVSGDSSGDDYFDQGESWIYQCVHVISELPRSIEMSAIVSGTPDGGGSLETASATVTVEVFHPAVQLEASIDPMLVGSKVIYTFGVVNTGDTPLSHVVVTSADCLTAIVGPSSDDGGDGEIAPDVMESWYFQCDGPVAGATDTTFHVEGAVEARDGLGRTVTASGSGDASVLHPSITMTSAAKPTTAHPGETVTFTYKLTNTGDTQIGTTSVKFTACDAGTLKYGDADDNGSLTPGEAWNGSCTHKVTESIGATVKNTFTFSGHGGINLGATASASVKITANATQQPSAIPSFAPTDAPSEAASPGPSVAAPTALATAAPATAAPATAAPTQAPSAPASAEGSSMPLLLVGGLIVIVAAVGGWFAWQRRRQP